MASKKENRYSSLVGYVFERGFKKGKTEFTFTRDQFVAAAKKLRITLPKNIGLFCKIGHVHSGLRHGVAA